MASRRRRGDGPLPLSTSIEQVAGRLTKVDLLGFAAIADAWEGIVGSPMAAHLTPRTLEGTTLTVGVDAPAWATQARLASGAILAAIAAEVPVEVSELKVVVRAPEGPRT